MSPELKDSLKDAWTAVTLVSAAAATYLGTGAALLGGIGQSKPGVLLAGSLVAAGGLTMLFKKLDNLDNPERESSAPVISVQPVRARNHMTFRG